MRKRRLISKSKTYGFHPWSDQVDAIDLIVKDTGLNESMVLRKLIDEALVARRRKVADEALAAESPEPERSDDSPMKEILLQVIKQNATSLRMQDISLVLIQETLAEARAGRTLNWKQLLPLLKEQGLTESDIAKRFEEESEAAKDFAYGVAQDVKTQQGQ